LLPATAFNEIAPSGRGWRVALQPFSMWQWPWTELPPVLMSALLIGCTLGLVKRPAALLATWLALVAMSLLFVLIYPGYYRHQALWLSFVVSMYWIVEGDGGGRAPGPRF